MIRGDSRWSQVIRARQQVRSRSCSLSCSFKSLSAVRFSRRPLISVATQTGTGLHAETIYSKLITSPPLKYRRDKLYYVLASIRQTAGLWRLRNRKAYLSDSLALLCVRGGQKQRLWGADECRVSGCSMWRHAALSARGSGGWLVAGRVPGVGCRVRVAADAVRAAWRRGRGHREIKPSWPWALFIPDRPGVDRDSHFHLRAISGLY